MYFKHSRKLRRYRIIFENTNVVYLIRLATIKSASSVTLILYEKRRTYIFGVILVSIVVQLGMPVKVAASYVKRELNYNKAMIVVDDIG